MRINSLLISVCLLANIGNTVFAQFFNPLTIRRAGGNTVTNIGNFGSYVYITNLGVFTDGGTPLTVGGIGGAGGYSVDTSGNLHFYGNSTFTSQTTNTFSGTAAFNGPVNTWRMNVLWQTNGIYLPTLSGTGSSYNANCTSTPTNIIVNTPFETNLFTVTIPRLSATNSRVVFDYVVSRTNSLTSVANFGLGWTVGSNFVTISSIPFATSPTFTNFLTFVSFGAGTGSEIFRNDGSMTVQQPIPSGNAALFSTPARSFMSSSLIDSSSSWSLTAKIGWASGAVNAATNLFIDRLVIYEVIPPY